MLVNREAPDWEGRPLEQRSTERRELCLDVQMDALMYGRTYVQNRRTSRMCGVKSGAENKHGILPCFQNSRTILVREITRIVVWE